MTKTAKKPFSEPLDLLIQDSYLFQGIEQTWLVDQLGDEELKVETLFSNRPIYTAFLPDEYLDSLYVVVEQGVVISRSTPLDRIVAITYPGGCLGMKNLPFSYGLACRAFPSLVEAYKTTKVIKIPLAILEQLYEASETIRDRYRTLFELQEKFQYHLLNCSTYPPQAVAALLRGLIYQERELKNQPQATAEYLFNLPTDLIARACQLNHRTVEQVLKGMQQVGLLELAKDEDKSGDLIKIIAPEELKSVYSSTRDKVSWWPLR